MLRLLRAPLALTGFVTLVSWLCFAACSGATDDEFQGTQENDAGGEPVYDEALAISNCESGCSAFADSCMASCTPGCDTSLRLSNAEICPGQFYAYYSCVGAAAAGDFASALASAADGAARGGIEQ